MVFMIQHGFFLIFRIFNWIKIETLWMPTLYIFLSWRYFRIYLYFRYSSKIKFQHRFSFRFLTPSNEQPTFHYNPFFKCFHELTKLHDAFAKKNTPKHKTRSPMILRVHRASTWSLPLTKWDTSIMKIISMIFIVKSLSFFLYYIAQAKVDEDLKYWMDLTNKMATFDS